MTINPVINCPDLETAKQHFLVARELLGEGAVAHVDIADGTFTNGYKTWSSPSELAGLIAQTKLRVALHIMVAKPEPVLESWLKSGISRVVLHQEAMSREEAALLASQCHAHGVEPYLGLTPSADMAAAIADLAFFDGCLVLAVNPGLSGQQFQESALEHIKTIKAAKPLMPIAVDGGITPEIARRCREAGASQVAAGAYIFNAADPKKAYEEFVVAVGD